jgi:hypothetical protein
MLWYATAMMLTEDLVPNTDPCTKPSTFSWSRCILFTFVFLTFIPGSLILFFFLSDRPYGVQAASMVSYTAAVILYTFSKNRGMQRYLFHCPFVRPQLPLLARRHAYFLVALFALQTAILQLRSHFSPFWLTAGSGSKRSAPPYVMLLGVLWIALCLSQILSNRSLLDRAHEAPEVA